MNARLLILILLTAVTLSSCRSRVMTAVPSAKPRTEAVSKVTNKPAAPRADDSDPLGDRLVSEARQWLGVPYLYGGNDRGGVDCSGLIVQVFTAVLPDVKLPRVSTEQAEFFPKITPDEMKPGDLLFFDTSQKRHGRVNHVGLYIGSGRMIHSSSSRGVIETDISAGSWYDGRLLSISRPRR